MTTNQPTNRLNLLDDLESRQDELIRQLDELDQRIERTLRQFQIQNRPGQEELRKAA